MSRKFVLLKITFYIVNKLINPIKVNLFHIASFHFVNCFFLILSCQKMPNPKFHPPTTKNSINPVAHNKWNFIVIFFRSAICCQTKSRNGFAVAMETRQCQRNAQSRSLFNPLVNAKITEL